MILENILLYKPLVYYTRNCHLHSPFSNSPSKTYELPNRSEIFAAIQRPGAQAKPAGLRLVVLILRGRNGIKDSGKYSLFEIWLRWDGRTDRRGRRVGQGSISKIMASEHSFRPQNSVRYYTVHGRSVDPFYYVYAHG